MSDKFKPFLNQNYDLILRDLLKEGKKFDDPLFPATDSSINFQNKSLIWKRPHEFCDKPQFIVGGIEPTDLDQGSLADCWLVAALAAVATVPEYIDIIVPKDQFFDKNYAGIFRFRFWRFGEWVEVVVDDRLPTNSSNQLEFCKNKIDKNEMFGPLLEKAYAKINKSYANMNFGYISDALVDFTGGVHEIYYIDDIGQSGYPNKEQFWELMIKSFAMKSIIGASVGNSSNNNSLTLGHAYSVLGVYELVKTNGQTQLRTKIEEKPSTQTTKLIKIRNPLGDDKSFVGEWSTNKNLWANLSQEIKDILDADKQIDGQFLITYDEFFSNYERLTFVHTNLAAYESYDSNLNSRVEWITKIMHGSWIKGKTAGGFGEEKYEDYFMNPQFLINLQALNDFDDKVTTIFSLMQCDLTNNVDPKKAKIEVFRVNDGVPYKKKYIYSDLEQVYFFRGYKRELAMKLDLKPGNYVLIPSLEMKDDEARFLIRVFFEGKENVNFKGVNLGARKKEKKDMSIKVEEPKKVEIKKVDENKDEKKNKEKEEEEGEGQENDDYDEYDDEYNDQCGDDDKNQENSIPDEYKEKIKSKSHDKKQNGSKACLLM